MNLRIPLLLGRIVLAMLLLVGSGCTGIAYQELRYPDRDHTENPAAWGAVRRGADYVLLEEMFLNAGNLDRDRFEYKKEGSSVWSKPRADYSIRTYPDAVRFPKGTVVRFDSFIVARRITTTHPSVFVVIASGELAGTKLRANDLVSFRQTSPDDWVITAENPQLVKPR
ncbi:MAG: hypothetical protein ACR2RV_21240 [Verrucomicrobiales bacterium]